MLHANRGRLLLRTPGPVPCWTCIRSNVETNHSWNCLHSRLLSFEHPSVLLLCFPKLKILMLSKRYELIEVYHKCIPLFRTRWLCFKYRSCGIVAIRYVKWYRIIQDMNKNYISPIHTATFAYLSNFYTCVYLLRCAILVVWTQLLICKSCTREQICTWSRLGANLLLLICCSKFFASVCKCGRMNAQQIYLYMYFTNLTALISILSNFMVRHAFCENIISK